MRNLIRLRCVLMLSNFCCIASTSAQQITAIVRGTITDASGAVVTNAKVTAVQRETGFTRTVISDSQGAYHLVELPVGHYQLFAEAKGFQKFVQEGISLDVNQNASVMIHLAVGIATEEVHVQANASLVETTVTSLGKTVQEREILGLPLDGRHFTQLGLLQPGVVPLTQGLQGCRRLVARRTSLRCEWAAAGVQQLSD